MEASETHPATRDQAEHPAPPPQVPCGPAFRLSRAASLQATCPVPLSFGLALSESGSAHRARDPARPGTLNKAAWTKLECPRNGIGHERPAGRICIIYLVEPLGPAWSGALGLASPRRRAPPGQRAGRSPRVPRVPRAWFPGCGLSREEVGGQALQWEGPGSLSPGATEAAGR